MSHPSVGAASAGAYRKSGFSRDPLSKLKFISVCILGMRGSACHRGFRRDPRCLEDEGSGYRNSLRHGRSRDRKRRFGTKAPPPKIDVCRSAFAATFRRLEGGGSGRGLSCQKQPAVSWSESSGRMGFKLIQTPSEKRGFPASDGIAVEMNFEIQRACSNPQSDL